MKKFKEIKEARDMGDPAMGMDKKQKMKFDQLMKKLDGGKEHMKFRRMAKTPVQGDDMFFGYIKDLATGAIKESVKKNRYVNENPFAMISKVKKVADTVGNVKDLVTGEDNNKELTSLVDQARKLLSGETEAQKSVELDKPKKEKNPYDGRMKLAKEFMQRMDKRRGK